MTEWRTSYSEGYRIDTARGTSGYEVEVVIYQPGRDVAATFVVRKQFGLERTRAKLAARAAAWVAADPETRRTMQELERGPSRERGWWWQRFWRG